MSTGLIVVITFGVIWTVWTLAAYIRLVRLRNAIARAFSVLVARIKERHTLIEVLSAGIQTSLQTGTDATDMPAMSTALKQATEAMLAAHRHACASCAVAAPRSLMAGPVRQMALAEDALGQALSHWQDQLVQTPWADQAIPLMDVQTRIDAARQAYNAAAHAYHEALQPLPTAVIANLFRFDPVSVLVLRTPRHVH